MIGSKRFRFSNTSQPVVAITVALLLLSTTVPAISGAQAVTSVSSQSSVDTIPVRAQQATPNNSSVIRHQNPENESEDGNLDAVSLQLSRSLANRLSQSSISISRDQYELARRYVGEEYRKEAARYVEVTEETPNESDDQVAERLNRTAVEQQQFTNRLKEFNETRERYREARQTGNESGARDLARELRRIADGLQRTGGNLVTNYNQISDQTSVDLSRETEILNQTVAQRTSEVQQVQDTEFERTSLTVETTTDSPNVSFVTPAELQGRLTSSGEPLANRSIELEIGTQRIETETDDDGRFTTEYRPVTPSLGTQQLEVMYVPQNQSNYQRSNDTIQVRVSQVSPDVTVSSNTSQARFNETVQVTVSVSANNRPVATAPVSMFVAGERITTNTMRAETNETGRYTNEVRIPLRLPAGEQPIRTVVGNETNAIGEAEARTNITVLPTNASLALATRRVNESATGPERREVITQGQLATENGTPINGESIEIAVRGTPMTTVRTDANGRFNTTIEVPARFLPSTVGAEEDIEITAVYANEDTNLEDTTTTSGVLFQAELLNVVGQNLSWSRTLAAFLVLGSAVALRRRYDQARIEEVPDTADTSQRTASEDGSDDASLLELANRWLEAGRTRAAVQFAYAAARMQFAEVYDISAKKTHWEFYQACWAASSEDEVMNDFEQLTALYERAAFANTPIERATAAEAYLLADDIREKLDAEPTAGSETAESIEPIASTTQGASQSELEGDD